MALFFYKYLHSYIADKSETPFDMFISYFDESGDDGYPTYSSELFVLSSLYMHETHWKENLQSIQSFRKILKAEYGFLVKEEFHTKEFITDKNPYHGRFEPTVRKKILQDHCYLLSTLKLKCVSVVIDKKNINRPKYEILKNALTYSIQRIENDLNKTYTGERFMIISDEGRVAKMRETTRKIQRINYIPSKFSFSSYRQEIQNLIEDPLPKNSQESYFIQFADLLAFLVSLYAKRNLCNEKIDWGKRILNVLDYGDEINLLDILRPCLNLKASTKNSYGIVYYPQSQNKTAPSK